LFAFSFDLHNLLTNEAGTGMVPQAPSPILSQLPQSVAGKLYLDT